MLPDLATLKPMPEPFEVFEPLPNVPVDLHVTSYSTGRATIKPRDGRPPQEIVVLRVNVPTADKATLPAWWDITSKHLVAGLLAYLDAGGAAKYTFRVTKIGQGAAARFTLEAVPR